MLFFLTYDLRAERDYQTLYDELDRLNAVRVLESTWCFKRVNTTPEGLRDHFKGFVDSDDGLIVCQVAAWGSFKTDGTPSNLS